MKQFVSIVLFLIVLGAMQSCKDDPPCNEPTNPKCSNYDPCYDKKPVSANFEIGLTEDPFTITKFTGMFEEDTIFPDGALHFRAKIKNAKYIWKLGSETIYDSAFTRTFYKVPFGRYKVTLIVEKDPDLRCFPNNNGRDTLTRYFHIVEPCKLKTTGSYKGVWEGQKDSFIFKIMHMGGKGGLYRWDTCMEYNFVIINGRKLNPIPDTLEYSVEYRIGNLFVKILDDGSENIFGEFKINPITNKLRFEYKYNHSNNHVVFDGRKL